MDDMLELEPPEETVVENSGSLGLDSFLKYDQ